MSSKTKNLGLTTWDDTDPVDFEEINDNFEKIDNLVSCIESGVAQSTYTGGARETVDWHYKKYSDGSVDMTGVVYYTTLLCSNGDAPLYSSDVSDVTFPFEFNDIFDVQMNLTSGTFGWVCNANSATSLDHISLRIYNMWKETADVYKYIYINIKGKLAT